MIPQEYKITYDFIYEKIDGDFDYGTNWGGANSKQKEALRFLYEHEAFSEQSSKISISHFIRVLEGIFRVKEVQARNRYLEMKDKKLLDSKQIGQNETRVWLKIKPEDHQKYLEGYQGYQGYAMYNNVFLAKNDTLSRIKPL